MQIIFMPTTCSIQWQDWRGKGKKLSQVVTDVCHMYGTGRGVTTDNFFTSCELADFL